jgi:hypothetical protein
VTDEERPRRPNEKYKLSKGDSLVDPKEEELVFYYNREHRLAKAPQSVRDLYTAQKKPRFNLLRPLVADKPRAILFFTILIICIFIVVFSVLGLFDSSYTLEGNKIEIRETVYDGTTIVDLSKKAKNSEAYSGAIDIAVTAAVRPDEETPLFYHRVFFTLTPEEEYRFVVPFSSSELLMLVQTEKSVLKIILKPK